MDSSTSNRDKLQDLFRNPLQAFELVEMVQEIPRSNTIRHEVKPTISDVPLKKTRNRRIHSLLVTLSVCTFISVAMVVGILVVYWTAVDDSGSTYLSICLSYSNNESSFDECLDEPCRYAFTSNTRSFIVPTFRQFPIAAKDLNGDTHQDIVVVSPNNNIIEVFLGVGNGTFERRPIYSTAFVSHPSWTALEDVNNDSKFDMIVADLDQNNLCIFLGYGNGTFTDGQNVSLGTSRPFTFIVHDFNNDTYPDILIGNYGIGTVGLLLGFGDGNFSQIRTFRIGDDSFVHALAAGDVNHDLKADFVLADHGTNSISIFLGDGNGTFVEHMTYPTGPISAPKSIALADLNNDEQLDLIVANYGHDNISVFFGYGNGSFHLHGTYTTGFNSRPYCVVVSDFNNDNHTDIAVSNSGKDNIGIFLGYGDGRFRKQKTYAFASYSNLQTLLVAHFNNDSRLDIIVSLNSVKNIGLLFGDSEKLFVPAMKYSSGLNTEPVAVASADFNEDGILDLVVVNFGINNIEILLGYGDGTFRRYKTYSTGSKSKPFAVAIDDLNNDTAWDIVVANGDVGNIGVFLGFGNGSFSSQVTYSTDDESYPSSVVIGDFNNDYFLDVAVANFGTGNIGIFMGHGDGTLKNQAIYSTGDNSTPRSLATGDFNKDTFLDIAVTDRANEKLGILFGQANGTFDRIVFYSTGNGSSPRVNIAVDLNNDTHLDIIIANPGTNSLAIFFGDQNGRFERSVIHSNDSQWLPYSLTAGDFNNDDRVDIAVVDPVSSEISILLGNVNQTLGPIIKYQMNRDSAPSSIITADVNDDGQLDIITTASLYHNVLILIGYSNSPFIEVKTYATGSILSPFAVAVSDVNGDMYNDIIVANREGDNVGVLLGYGNGNFSEESIYLTGDGSRPTAIVTSDINKDHHLDIITANSDGNHIGILSGYGNGSFMDQILYHTGTNSRPHSVVVSDFNNDTYADVAVANFGLSEIAVLLNYGRGALNDQIVLSVNDSALPSAVSSGDFNKDLYFDIVVANMAETSITIFLGDGDGTFRRGRSYPTGVNSSPRYLVVGDFDGDQILDVAVANIDNIGIFLGNGDGTFLDQVSFFTGSDSQPWCMALGDFNHDKNIDIAVVNGAKDEMIILLGDGSGTFMNGTKHSTGSNSSPRFIITADLNTDDRLDIVVVNTGSSEILILFGTGDGTFLNQSTYSTGALSLPRSAAIGDFNGDNRSDIAVGNDYKNEIVVLLGHSNGTFPDRKFFFTGLDTRPRSLVTGDFNRDGRLDLGVAYNQGNMVGILLGKGDGSFFGQVTYSTGLATYPSSLTMADFNNDDWLDLAVANPYAANIGLFLSDWRRQFFIYNSYSTPLNSEPRFVCTGDINNDRVSDIIVANSANDSVGIFLGNGDGTFQKHLSFKTGSKSTPWFVAVRDLNNDTRLDLIVVNRQSNELGILLGDGTGEFTDIVTFSADMIIDPLTADVIDFNNDQIFDIVIVNNGTNNLAVFLGFGNGSFRYETKFSTGYNSRPSAIAIGDVDNDQSMDVVVTNHRTKEVKILSKRLENIIGLSCIENTACWFFHNYSLPYTIINSSNTSFYFLILPPEKQTFLFETTEDFPSVTTMATNVVYTKLTTNATWSPIGESVAGYGSVGSGAMLSLAGPGPIVFDIDNNLYVNDYGHHRVIFYPSDGGTPSVVAGIGTAGSAMNQLSSPNGIAVDSSGTLYIADQNNHRIQRWLPGASTGTTVAGITGNGGSNFTQLNKPQSVTIDSNGNMYICDSNNNRVLRWRIGASQGTLVAGNGRTGTTLNNIASAFDAQVDADGHIYVPDFTNGRVLKWSPPSASGTLVAGQISSSGSSASQLKQPTQVIIDSSDTVYICDYGNHRIQRWLNGSTVGSTIIGTGTAGRSSNQLNGPYGIAFDTFHNLHVADSNNNRIQRFNLTHH